MDKYIKIGIGVMILDGNKILLGHRAKDKKDTGGIFEVDCWTLPGGKQEYNETFFEGAKRERAHYPVDIVNAERRQSGRMRQTRSERERRRTSEARTNLLTGVSRKEARTS